MNAKSLTISGISSVSTPSFSPLFTNLSGIVDGHANSLGLLVLLHAPAPWPVETCRETSLNHKAVAIHQSIFHMITILSSSNGNFQHQCSPKPQSIILPMTDIQYQDLY